MNANVDNNEVDMLCCASCGIAENDDVKLKNCAACYLVRYCSVNCQKNHRPKHKRDCKKRAAELRDELLFKQPESSCLGDCPICLIPLSLDQTKSVMTGCCSKQICRGCSSANALREFEQGLEQRCPFCRQIPPMSDRENEKNVMKRVEANDPVALREVGTKRRGEGDYKVAFRFLTKAVELGDSMAHHQLACLYSLGLGVEKDKKKEVYHEEEAAIGGHPEARYNLGGYEWNDGRHERGIKHWIIAASLGDNQSVETLKEIHQDGWVSKEDFVTALRAHQAAVDATKSPHREAAVGKATPATCLL